MTRAVALVNQTRKCDSGLKTITRDAGRGKDRGSGRGRGRDVTLKAMFEEVMDDHATTDEGLSRRKRRKKPIADSMLGSFSDSDVNQR